MKPAPLPKHRPRRSVAPVLLALAGAPLALTGCKVGPDYTTPAAPVPERWLDLQAQTSPQASPQGAATPADAPPERWWTTFGDPRLDRLIELATTQNLSLRQAGLRVIQARAARGLAVGQFFPQTQAATGSLSNNRVSQNSPQGAGDRSYHDASIGLDAVWELDFWGRFRRGVESADASLEAAVADYDSVLVLLAADVASTYISIRQLDEQLAFTRANVTSLTDTLDLTGVRFRAGAVSELDVSTAQATLSNTRALLPQLEDARRQAVLSLSVLLGQTPSELTDLLAGATAVPEAPARLAAGVPADLLRRRPDVRRAERTAAAYSAQIGVATADLYPSIRVSGRTSFVTSSYEGRLSPGLENLLDAQSFQGFIGLDASWPIFNYGRIENNIRIADAQYQQAVTQYQNTVLVAAAEVESAFSSFLRSRERADHLAASVSAAQRSVELALIQYRQGAIDFLRVNQAQVELVDRQNSFVAARADIAIGAISAYRALGGGWEVRGASEFIPQSTIDEMRARTDWGDILPASTTTPPADSKEPPHADSH